MPKPSTTQNSIKHGRSLKKHRVPVVNFRGKLRRSQRLITDIFPKYIYAYYAIELKRVIHNVQHFYIDICIYFFAWDMCSSKRCYLIVCVRKLKFLKTSRGYEINLLIMACVGLVHGWCLALRSCDNKACYLQSLFILRRLYFNVIKYSLRRDKAGGITLLVVCSRVWISVPFILIAQYL